MRALLFVAAGLFAVTPDFALAQIKLSTKPDPNAIETRYFTAIDVLMDGNADVILKEVRQGKTLKEASLDICYPADKASDRKDRFVVNLAVNGGTLSGTTQTLGDKKPVTVKLTRKQTGDTFDFRGQITVGANTTEVASSENSDISEKEFKDSQVVDDGINPQPKNFSDVSRESVGVRLKLESALDYLKSLRGQDVVVATNSLGVTCDALRSGVQTINLSVDPERAPALIAKAKATPGVVAAGWTTGIVEMERTIRISAADYSEGGKLNRDKLASAVSNVLAKVLSAKPAGASWSSTTGKVKLSFKRPSPVYPALELTDTVEVTGLVAPDKPGGSDKLMVWIGNPVTSTADESAGSKLILSNDSA